jgi:rubrerythrin
LTTKDLVPSEISNLWNTYLSNTMTVWVTRYLLANIQDEEIYNMLKNAEMFSVKQEEKSKKFLEEAGYPLPDGFDEQDVDVKCQPLYSDNFILYTKFVLAQQGCIFYSMFLATSINSDIRQFYEYCWTNSKNIYNQCADIMVKKGLHHPKLHVPKPERVDKVDNQSFLAGWFTDRRPLNVQEISQLEFCFKATEHNKEFLKSFAQTSQSKELRNHFQRGAEISQKHLEIFQNILSENDLPHLPTWESEITDSTVAPFSDRLMLYKMTLLTGLISTNYGTALSTMMRRDLGLHFIRLRTELLKYGEDTLNLMIKHEYLDQLPMAKEKPTVHSSE